MDLSASQQAQGGGQASKAQAAGGVGADELAPAMVLADDFSDLMGDDDDDLADLTDEDLEFLAFMADEEGNALTPPAAMERLSRKKEVVPVADIKTVVGATVANEEERAKQETYFFLMVFETMEDADRNRVVHLIMDLLEVHGAGALERESGLVKKPQTAIFKQILANKTIVEAIEELLFRVVEHVNGDRNFDKMHKVLFTGTNFENLAVVLDVMAEEGGARLFHTKLMRRLLSLEEKTPSTLYEAVELHKLLNQKAVVARAEKTVRAV
jgi:hypothetical protein